MGKVEYLKDRLNKAKIKFSEGGTPEGAIISFDVSNLKCIRWTHGSIQAMPIKDIDSVLNKVIEDLK